MHIFVFTYSRRRQGRRRAWRPVGRTVYILKIYDSTSSAISVRRKRNKRRNFCVEPDRDRTYRWNPNAIKFVILLYPIAIYGTSKRCISDFCDRRTAYLGKRPERRERCCWNSMSARPGCFVTRTRHSEPIDPTTKISFRRKIRCTLQPCISHSGPKIVSGRRKSEN